MQRLHHYPYLMKRKLIADIKRRETLHLPRCQSNFSFNVVGDVRHFQHLCKVDGATFDCRLCHSICAVTDPYRLHWNPPVDEQQRNHEREADQVTEQKDQHPNALNLIAHIGATPGNIQRMQLNFICENNVEQFVLFNELSASEDGQKFLVDAGTYALPQLLRLLFHTCDKMHVRLGVLARVRSRKKLLFRSSELAVGHHLDIPASVDVLLIMLLHEVNIFAKRSCNYCVRAIHIEVRREQRPTVLSGSSVENAKVMLALPLEYRLKCATDQRSVITATEWYALSQEQRDSVNLYGFRECIRWQQLFIMPYQYRRISNSNTAAKDQTGGNVLQATTSAGSVFLPGGNYVIVCNIAGELQYLMRITDIERFTWADDGSDERVRTCEGCFASFGQRVKFVLHQKLGCGRGFEAHEVTEKYKRCLNMKSDQYAWKLYAIVD